MASDYLSKIILSNSGYTLYADSTENTLNLSKNGYKIEYRVQSKF